MFNRDKTEQLKSLIGTLQVKKTMRAIKHALTERQYTWEDAVDVARNDPEIEAGKEGLMYTPSAYEEEIDEEHGWEEVEVDKDSSAAVASGAIPEPSTQAKTPEVTR
jgi:large subunit ribosomal protein L47